VVVFLVPTPRENQSKDNNKNSRATTLLFFVHMRLWQNMKLPM